MNNVKGLRFQKRKRILPGVWLNVSKTGVSVSIGPPGLKINIGKRGIWFTVGLPGSGLSYRKQLKKGKGNGEQHAED